VENIFGNTHNFAILIWQHQCTYICNAYFALHIFAASKNLQCMFCTIYIWNDYIFYSDWNYLIYQW